MPLNNIQSRVQGVLHESLGVYHAPSHYMATLYLEDDLCVDNKAMANIRQGLADEFDIQVSPDDSLDWKTVYDITNWVFENY